MPKTTRTDIIRSFEKLLMKMKYEKITVKDLTESCGLNRKTFYYYFSDMDDLLTKAFDFEMNAYLESAKSSDRPDEVLEGFVKAVKEYNKIVYHIYNSPRSEHITEYLRKTIEDIMENSAAESLAGYDISDDQRKYISRIYAFTIFGFIIHWIDGGMQDDFVNYVKQLRIVFSGSEKLFATNAEKANRGEF